VKKMAPKKQRMTGGAYRYLQQHGPSNARQMTDDLNSSSRAVGYSTNQLSNVLKFSNLFYRAGTESLVSLSGSKYDMIIWDVIPLNVVAKRYANEVKHRLIPISSQPKFVQDYINEYLEGCK